MGAARGYIPTFILSSCVAVVLNLGVATQNWVAGIPMGREYFIKITLFFILDKPFDKSESAWKRK
jgi:hypothetical protein